uniref:Basic helix-loop-helix ARNT like 2 n=1 Tax=Acanthochromis polyacanthus TaxID=80966 RepID=A0A3Q1EMR1_9TELE
MYSFAVCDGCFHVPDVPDPAAEDKGRSQAGPSLSATELPRKRKGDLEVEVEVEGMAVCATDCKLSPHREPHRQIEKRRRDKMNNLIDELSAMIPACQPMARKLDKLTVLRKAVQHLKALKGNSQPTQHFKVHLLLRVATADGFLLVVSCDRAKILFISESVSKILNFKRMDLTGQSLFDFIHPKDINKVKEQLSSSDMSSRQRLIDAASKCVDAPVRTSHLSSGARRSFFCRMKHSQVAGKHDDKHSLPSTYKKKDAYRYCTLHCTGYMRSWPSSQLDSEGDIDKETSTLTCLVTVCRLNPHVSQHPSKEINVKPTKFITRCAIDGKFTFVDQQATTVIGYLPQELLGTSCYEYFHQDDLPHLAEKHRQVLRSKEKIETKCYKFKTKYGSYVSLQSQWFSFTNPWTKEVDFIVSSNKLLRCAGGEGAGGIRGRQRRRASSSLFLASHHRCIKSKADPKIPSGTIGMSRMSSFSQSDRLARLSHRARSCSIIDPSAFPVAQTAQRWTQRHRSVMTGISSHVAGS